MSPLAPETATGPLAQAPPDRPTAQLEDLLNQVLAIVGADRALDMNERAVFRTFMQQLAMLANQPGGIGAGAPAGPQDLGQSPMEMNANTEDMGTVEGAAPEEEY